MFGHVVSGGLNNLILFAYESERSSSIVIRGDNFGKNSNVVANIFTLAVEQQLSRHYGRLWLLSQGWRQIAIAIAFAKVSQGELANLINSHLLSMNRRVMFYYLVESNGAPNAVSLATNTCGSQAN